MLGLNSSWAIALINGVQRVGGEVMLFDDFFGSMDMLNRGNTFTGQDPQHFGVTGLSDFHAIVYNGVVGIVGTQNKVVRIFRIIFSKGHGEFSGGNQASSCFVALYSTSFGNIAVAFHFDVTVTFLFVEFSLAFLLIGVNGGEARVNIPSSHKFVNIEVVYNFDILAVSDEGNSADTAYDAGGGQEQTETSEHFV